MSFWLKETTLRKSFFINRHNDYIASIIKHYIISLKGLHSTNAAFQIYILEISLIIPHHFQNISKSIIPKISWFQINVSHDLNIYLVSKFSLIPK